jgi:hypothetical protein
MRRSSLSLLKNSFGAKPFKCSPFCEKFAPKMKTKNNKEKKKRKKKQNKNRKLKACEISGKIQPKGPHNSINFRIAPPQNLHDFLAFQPHH